MDQSRLQACTAELEQLLARLAPGHLLSGEPTPPGS